MAGTRGPVVGDTDTVTFVPIGPNRWRLEPEGRTPRSEGGEWLYLTRAERELLAIALDLLEQPAGAGIDLEELHRKVRPSS
jgi:hypothetical protein